MIATHSISILNSMVREDLTEKVTFEQSPKRSSGDRHTATWARSIFDKMKQTEISSGGSSSGVCKEKQGGSVGENNKQRGELLEELRR